MRFAPPFDPMELNDLAGCRRAMAAIATELSRVSIDGSLHKTRAGVQYGAYLRNLRAEVKAKLAALANDDRVHQRHFLTRLTEVLDDELGPERRKRLFRSANLLVEEDEARDKIRRAVMPAGSAVEPRATGTAQRTPNLLRTHDGRTRARGEDEAG
jgi:hypothetical protein